MTSRREPLKAAGSWALATPAVLGGQSDVILLVRFFDMARSVPGPDDSLARQSQLENPCPFAA